MQPYYRLTGTLIPILLLAFCVSSRAQSYVVQLHAADTALLSAAKLKTQNEFKHQEDAVSYLQGLVPELQERGYLAASIDSMVLGETRYDLYVYTGRQYRWSKVDFSSIPTGILAEAAINTRQYEQVPVSPKQLSRLTEKLVTYNEEHGYPFARVWLEQATIDTAGQVSGRLMLDRGVLCKIDSIEVEGEVRISQSFISQYLDILPGSLYHEKKLRNISPRLRELPFLEEARPWYVSFRNGDTRLHLVLREKKANQLNAIVGLLPNSVETGKFLLTVDAQFAFQNILGYGEAMSVSYQSLQYKSPRLKADASFPYLFNTPIGAEGHFDLFRKDTTFRRTSLQLGLRYQLSATDYIRVYYLNQSNRIITLDTAFVKAQKRLPDYADVSANGGGLELGINRTDYRIAPRKGWQVRLAVNVLQRKVTRNDAVLQLQDAGGFNYASLYDSLEQRKYQYNFNGDAAYFIPVGRKATLKIGYNGGWISGARLFQNELFQIGGFKLLRGFDEQSIYAAQYHVGVLEFRLFLDRNSYVYLFSDNGWVASNINGVVTERVYNGFGIGTTLQTKTGLFSISYALGRSDVAPALFKQSKIHFGYVAYF